MSDFTIMPLLIIIGSFYAFAGVVAARAALMDAMLDVALAGITLESRDPLDVERSGWMLAGACATGASGVLLAAGSMLALPAFLLSSGMQALHFLILSPKRYDVVDPVPKEGRQQSLSAFWLYLIVTAFVSWATWAGHLRNISGWNTYVLYGLCAIWLLASVWSFHWLLTIEDQPKAQSDTVDERDPYFDAQAHEATRKWAANVHIVLAPTALSYPLFNRENNEALHYLEIQDLNLPDAVMDDVMNYASLCLKAIDPNDPLMDIIADPDKAHELHTFGEQLFLKLQSQFGDRVTFDAAFRPNVPKRFVARLDVVGCPWTSGVFEGWPDTYEGEAGGEGEREDVWLNLLGVSFGLINDMAAWIADTHSLYIFETKEVLPETTSEALANSVNAGRALAIRLAKEFAATNRADVPIMYHPVNALPEEIKL